jgi:HK97 family phage portal protein
LRLFGYEFKLMATKAGSSGLASPSGWLTSMLGGGTTAAGVSISESNALQVSDVYKCVRVLSEAVAMLPWKVYQRVDRGKNLAIDHAVFSVLHDEPNDYMTSFVFRELLMAHVLLWGNSYGYIERTKGGKVAAVWPLSPAATRCKRENGVLSYVSRTYDGSEVSFFPDEILHVPGLSFDGLCGYSPIQLQREAMGLSKATEMYGARFFGNGTRPDGALVHPGKLSEDAIKKLKKSWEERHNGDNQHRVAVLEEGLTWTPFSIQPDHAQFIETRKFQRSEIAGMFRVPPHMIGDLERSTNNNIEQQALEFYAYSVMPWLERIEQEANRKLFSASEKATYFCEFETKGVLRGDSASRVAFYKDMFYIGAYSQNQILASENENPIDGGDQHYVPINMIPIDLISEFFQSGSANSSGNQDKNAAQNAKKLPTLELLQSRVRATFGRIFRDSVGRVVARAPESREKFAPAAFLHLFLALSEAINGKLTPETQKFVEEYSNSIGQRVAQWTAGQEDEITVFELDRAVKALFERGISHEASVS